MSILIVIFCEFFLSPLKKSHEVTLIISQTKKN